MRYRNGKDFMFYVLVATYIEIMGVLLLNDSHSAQAEPYYYCLTREVLTVQWLLSDCGSSTNPLGSCSSLCQMKREESLCICTELSARAGSDPLTEE